MNLVNRVATEIKSAEEILLPIQYAQQEHDFRAHRDILNLDTQTRLKHFTLHFLKYAGKIARARESDDRTTLGGVLVDSFIICLATANALNVNIGAAIPRAAQNLDGLAVNLSEAAKTGDLFLKALLDLVTISGQMAKSIESTDHLERGNPRAELEQLIVELSTATLASTGALNLGLSAAVKSRWKSVEDKSIFRGA